MLVGAARVSTLSHKPGVQTGAHKVAGCERIFTEQVSGAQRDRLERNWYHRTRNRYRVVAALLF